MIQEFIEAFDKYQGTNKTTDKITFHPHLTIWRKCKTEIKIFELKVKQVGIVSIVISTTVGDTDKATVPVGILTNLEQQFILEKVKSNEIN